MHRGVDMQENNMNIWMDDLRFFTSFSTVSQSYQDDGRVITEDSVQFNATKGAESLFSLVSNSTSYRKFGRKKKMCRSC